MSAPEKNYKETILLPNTTFPMRGDLTINEPKRLEKWESSKLYHRILKNRTDQNAPRFLLHDGPPFANGDVHMGTALNKILKDMVLKSKTMAGFAAPYTPGWDCHGLPIEFKVVQKARDLDPAEIRRRCTEFAKGFIDIQRTSFRRLGVFGEWDHPYLTMDPAYEANVLRVFAKLVEDGAVYQSRKPVQWSYGAYTALAEAEVEYKEITSTSIFVRFPLIAPPFDVDASMVIWTTTPWTLPSNVGIALHPRFTYILGQFIKDDKTANFVILKDLVQNFTLKTGWELAETLKELKGIELDGCNAAHPFLPRQSRIIMGEFVTTETGTGAVHIAPGHGADDYTVGRQNGLEVLSPVNDDGTYTEDVGVPSLVGKHVFSVDNDILSLLDKEDALLGKESYAHQYPHCWRSKTPIIFRAVEQFFISMDKLRPKALEEIDKVQWLPSWGRNRIYGTVEARPDWCISRQRTWGLPLPVFFDADNKALLDATLIRKIADLVQEHGSNIWFEKSDAELCSLLGIPLDLKKGRDTLDVWIDSGSSHMAVMDSIPGLDAPADLYLEATDQHRGWFQSSLMLSVAWRGKAPYKAVMTHAFVVDKDTGKKTSKSDAKSGKPTDAVYFYDKYGADIVRLWASSVDWQNEVPFGEDLFKQVAEPYRRLRNTLRILLGNINDFDPATDTVPAEQMPLLDRWIMERMNEVIAEARKAYNMYEFRKVFNVINQFCSSDLSAIYVDTTKDRLYCDERNSLRRRATQTVMTHVFTSLCKLLAPILAYTTDEAWEHAGFTKSIHEEDFPQIDRNFDSQEATGMIARMLEIKSIIQVAIEEQVKNKAFTKNNEASVTLTVPRDEAENVVALLSDRQFSTEFFIIADLNVSLGDTLTATACKTAHTMCPRCRRYEPLTDTGLCERCADLA
ncbi:MAG: isoleucine--tRNA ligase [Akkermansia sp.]